MSRRVKCNPELTREICKVLKAGNYTKIACEYVGIHETTFYKWRARGESEIARLAEDGRRKIKSSEAAYVEFVESTTHARAMSEVESVVRIRTAGATDWRAEAWFLEHSKPDRWGRRNVKIEHSGPNDGPIAITADSEELDAQIAKLQAVIAAADGD